MKRKIYKYNFFFCRGQTGSAMLSTLISVALLGISGAGLLQYVNNFRKTTDQTLERVNVDPLIRAMVINNLRSLLIEKNVQADGNQSEQNRYGICSFLKKPKYSDEKVQDLKISFSERSSFANSRWEEFFPETEWKKVDAEHCRKIKKDFSEGDFSKCFMYVKRTEQADDIVYVVAKIIPREFPSLEPIGVSQAADYDPKQVVFQLYTAVSVYSFNEDELSDHGQDPDDPEARGKSTAYMSYQSDALWADAVGECHVQAIDGEWVVVSLSATGPGSDLENRVVNSLKYGDPTCEERVTLLDINDDVVQIGRTDDDLISSYFQLNARVACTKNKFSCRHTIKTEPFDSSTYDSFQFSFNILNDTFGSIPVKNFNVTLKKSSGQEVDGDDNEQLAGVSLSFYHSHASSVPIDANSDIDYNLPIGSGFVTVSSDTSDDTQSEKMASYCHDICQNYNTGDDSTYIYPAVNIHEKAGESCTFTGNYSDSASNRVQCIVCHTKACHRYGIGTFGPLDNELRTIQVQNTPPTQHTVYGVSDEPLDGQVPECTVANAYETDGVRDIPEGVTGSGEDVVSDGSCKAMAMQLSGSNPFGSLKDNTYEKTECSTELPVLCFTNGHYLPALEINPSNLNSPPVVVKAKFQDAEEACFNIGREIAEYYQLGVIMANAYKVEFASTDFVTRTTETLKKLPRLAGSGGAGAIDVNTPSDAKFDFVNNASRGMFLAPSAYSQDYFKLTERIQDIINSLGSTNKVWTAMEWDAEGLVVGSPPWALVAKDDPYALFYDKREDKGNRPTLLKDTGNYNSASKYFALTYNVHWKGLVPQAAGKSYPYVCKNKTTDRFFITSSSGALSAGPARCNSAGGLFVPPESGLDWAKLMLELNSNDDYYPFPDPDLKPEDVANANFVYKKNFTNQVNGGRKAWVALQKVSGTKAAEKTGIRASELKLYSKHFPTDSVFRADTKQDILNALFDANRFSGDIKRRYSAHPMAAMTTSGLIPKGNSAKALLKAMYKVMKEVLKINEIDIENYGEKETQSVPSGYKKICLDMSQRNEYIPVSIQDLSATCPNGGVGLDIDNSLPGSAQLKPTSYKYGSYWIKNIGASDEEYVILTGGKIAERVSQYNGKIAFLGQCDGECTAEWNQCNSDCDSQYLPCPPCTTRSYTVTDGDGNIQTRYRRDCSAKRACERAHAACKATCDTEKEACRDECTGEAHAQFNI